MGAGLALLIVLAGSRGDVDRMTYGDGLLYQYIAANLTTAPEEIDDVVVDRGTGLRYGRIGLPVLIWLGSAGRNIAIPWAQPMLMVLAAAAAGGAASLLLPRAGPMAGAIPFLAPGFPLAISGGYAEAMAVAFLLWAVVLALHRRWWGAAVLGAGAVLTRENAVPVLLGLIAWLTVKHGRRALILTAALVPPAIWYVFTEVRFGSSPITDPYLRETGTVGPPVVALVRSVIDSPSAKALAAAVFHLLMAAVAVSLARRSMLGSLAAVASLQLLVTGPFAWHYIGDGARTAVFLQLFLVLALVSARIGNAAGSSAATGPRARTG